MTTEALSLSVSHALCVLFVRMRQVDRPGRATRVSARLHLLRNWILLPSVGEHGDQLVDNFIYRICAAALYFRTYIILTHNISCIDLTLYYRATLRHEWAVRIWHYTVLTQTLLNSVKSFWLWPSTFAVVCTTYKVLTHVLTLVQV